MRKYSTVRILVLMFLLSIIFAACSDDTVENKQSKNTVTTKQSQYENGNITNGAINKNESKYLELSSDMHVAGIELDEDRGSLLKKYGEPQAVNDDDPEYISITYDFAEIICRKDNNSSKAAESIISISSDKSGIEGPRGLKIGDTINLVSQSFGFEKDIDFNITGKAIYIYNEQKPDGSFFFRVDYSEKPNTGSIVICAYDIYALRINYKDSKITKMEVFEQQ